MSSVVSLLTRGPDDGMNRALRGSSIRSLDPAISDLAEQNAALLRSGARLIARLTDEIYTATNQPLSRSSVGAHVRHCLDRYLSLLSGGETIDYERREREIALERDRIAARDRIESICARLTDLREWRNETVRVAIEGGDEFSRSSLARELDAAASHTIHHYAIVAILLRARGIEPGEDFGVAPSTLRYLEEKR